MLQFEDCGLHILICATGEPVLDHRRKVRDGVRVSMRPGWMIVAALIVLACLSAVAQDGSRPALRGSFLQPALGDAWTLPTGVNGRYARVLVKPGWNAGWTFLDEIEVRQ